MNAKKIRFSCCCCVRWQYSFENTLFWFGLPFQAAAEFSYLCCGNVHKWDVVAFRCENIIICRETS